MSNYENHHLEDSILPFIYKTGSVRPTNHRFGSSNWHENLEVLYITEGDGIISDNSRVISVSRGDIAVINSNHLHVLAAGDRAMHFRYLIIDRSFCLSNGFDSSGLTYQSKINDPEILALMERLHTAYGQSSETDYQTLSIRTAVLQLMLLLCQKYSTPASHTLHTDRVATYVKQAIDYIRAAYAQNFSLEDVASFVGISSCYLSREFHRYTGYSFVAYVNRLRCKKAQQMLADGQLDIHEVGKRCGFENRSYFSKSFRQYIGMSPIEYRTRILKNPQKTE